MKKYYLKDICDIKIDIKAPCLVFLKGDLGAGKTTLSKHIIRNILWVKEEVTSPTYTYYNKYISPQWVEVYHFDLYRLQNHNEFFAIGWEDVFDNNHWIILVEWPELIEKYYNPDIEIILNKIEKEGEREMEIIKK